MLVVIAAGPAATLASGLATTMLFGAGRCPPVFAIAFVQLSLLLFTLGLIPNGRKARTRNDAQLFLELAFSRMSAKEMELYARLSQNLMAGVRPQDYSVDLLAELLDWRGRPDMEFLFAQTISRWALDSNDLEVADAWDAHALGLSGMCNERIRNKAIASSACFDVLFRNDFGSARTKFSEANLDALFPVCFEHLARACRHFAAGQIQMTPREILLAQYTLPPGVAAYSVERRMLDQLHMKVVGSPQVTEGLKTLAMSA